MLEGLATVQKQPGQEIKLLKSELNSTNEPSLQKVNKQTNAAGVKSAFTG